MNKVAELKKVIKELEELRVLTNEAEAKYENDCENIELEEEYDRLYGLEFNKTEKAINLIVELTGIESYTCRKMMIEQFEKITEIADSYIG